ncbi:MAG TPA: hypothetical protein DHW42_04990 [Candidatus Marinimicrobia bacterium]|nr:hypothetical protein [Candidatus Neomarinimicrobiota bacterium]
MKKISSDIIKKIKNGSKLQGALELQLLFTFYVERHNRLRYLQESRDVLSANCYKNKYLESVRKKL